MAGLYLGVEAATDTVVEAMSFNVHLFPSVFFNSPHPSFLYVVVLQIP